MDISRNFSRGRMNKTLDERLVPDGEYIDAVNIRVNSTEKTDGGTVENTVGNTLVVQLEYNGQPLDEEAVCVGAFEDGILETIYWFVHSPNDGVDMIVSYNEETSALIYHVVSESVLNFSREVLITQIDKIEDLLFFTDGVNPPRRINVKRSYPLEPDLTNKDLNVIVSPPNLSPSVELLRVPGDDNFITERIVSFAYRYQYRDGEYSALSQFSDYAFRPSFFRLDTQSYQNSGMQNSFNAAKVSFNTGGSDVVGIDVCFKIANSPVINVIEKFRKDKKGWVDDTDVSLIFKNKKIYTTLPESEILRLFDNVPLTAKAQTIMSNRLMYGNYKDGNELIDSNGEDIRTDFVVELVSEDIGNETIPVDTESGTYNVDPSEQGLQIPSSVVSIDFSDKDLIEGAALSFSLVFTRDRFTGADSELPESSVEDIVVNVNTVLKSSYSSPYLFSISDEFVELVGAASSYVGLNACGTNDEGLSIADRLSCAVNPPFSQSVNWEKVEIGIDATQEGIKIISEPGSSIVKLQSIAILYQPIGGGDILYEYFSITNANVDYQRLSNTGSLHSNRDYSVGIIYMDDYNRATTVLTSDRNSVYVPPSRSNQKNSLRITIPPNMKPPYWATKYKFAILPSGLDYETIYSNQFFIDPRDNSAYLKLEGDNQTKSKVGDTLIVKVDSSGPVPRLVKTRVLELEPKMRDFIEGNVDDNGNNIEEPPGLYMKVRPENWNVFYDPDNVLQSSTSEKGSFTRASLNVSSEDPDNVGQFIPWEIPEGSLVKFDIVIWRGPRARFGRVRYVIEKEFLARRNYSNIFDFVRGENVRFDTGLDTSEKTSTTFGVVDFDGDYEAVYYDCLFDGISSCPDEVTVRELGKHKFQFRLDPSTNKMTLEIRAGAIKIDGVFGIEQRFVHVEASVSVIKSNNIIVLETEPTESNPNVYFITSQSFKIDGGFHFANSQDQSIGIPAIVDLEAYNCFAFGNGVESYKINDALAAPFFRIGDQVSSVAEQDFKLADRFSSITYSGLFNPENNVNKLNEFNLGLANFKDLERVYGPIYVLHPRQTDVLVLQEDKVSYVLAGKNILSDAAAGGAVTSVPEVLGTQIARTEEYGISNNPESFVSWGFDKFFTDAKRGAVIQLTGSGASNEQLKVVSSMGMSPFFRELFIENLNKLKLGGYDPYMSEYVLHISEEDQFKALDIRECGSTYRVLNGVEGTTSYVVDLTSGTGNIDVAYDLQQLTLGESVEFRITYGASVFSSGVLTSSSQGTIPIFKSIPTLNRMRVDVVQSGGVSSWSVATPCPVSNRITVVKVTVNSDQYEGQFIHNEYFWKRGTVESSLNSEQTLLIGGSENLRIADFDQATGRQGFGFIPEEGSTVVVQSNRRDFDDFIFDPSIHKLKYLLSDTLYTKSEVDTILSLSQDATGLQEVSHGVFNAEFTYSNPNEFEYLYIIYDYRKAIPVELCYSEFSAFDACCNCEPEPIV